MSNEKRLKRTGQTADQVFHRLIEAILSGELPSGQPVPELRLAQEWKVGRTPLREAMRRAAESGFIVLRSNRRPVVRWLTRENIRDLYELRSLLELHALERSWAGITPAQIQAMLKLASQARPGKAGNWVQRCLDLDLALHGLWTEGCGNSWLIQDLDHHYRFLRVFQHWIGRDPEAVAMAYKEHLGILKAIEARDKARALALLGDHIAASAKSVERVLAKAELANPRPA
jgi:DNA-binding GntR family transcriptional regulator